MNRLKVKCKMSENGEKMAIRDSQSSRLRLQIACFVPPTQRYSINSDTKHRNAADPPIREAGTSECSVFLLDK